MQGIGWALNEEYVYGDDGVLQNPGFLDYRIPVASDLPFIDTVIVEVPNPNHPYGVRGCGEVPIIAPMAAIANAIENAKRVYIQDHIDNCLEDATGTISRGARSSFASA